MADDLLQTGDCARKLKALSEPLRLQIVDVLRRGPSNVSDLAQTLGTDLVTVSHHLNILFHAGIVEREKRGRFVIYSLAPGLLDAGDTPSGTEHLDLGCCRLEIPRVDLAE